MTIILKIPTKLNYMKPDTLLLPFNLLHNIPLGRFKQIRRVWILMVHKLLEKA